MNSLQLLNYDGDIDITTIVRKITYDYIITTVINNENRPTQLPHLIAARIAILLVREYIIHAQHMTLRKVIQLRQEKESIV